MRPGRVVKIRINPADCMSAVDVVRAAGAYHAGMSFAQVIVSALSIAMQTFRSNSIIPARDGFEFSEMMKEFGNQPHIDRELKLKITKFMQSQSMPGQIALPAIETNKKQTRLNELTFQYQQDAANMSEIDRNEMFTLIKELNPI